MRAAKHENPALWTPPARYTLGGPVDWDKELRPPDRKMPSELAAILRASEGPSRFLRHFAIGGNCPACLEYLLSVCQERGFQVVLVAPPVAAVHRQGYTPPIESEFQRYLAGLQERYPCRFVDCRDWLDDALFEDSHHQSEEGGRYFSRLFTYRVLAPWVNQRTQTRLH